MPFFGNIKESVLRRKHFAIVLKDIYNAYPNEKVVGVYRMTTPALLIRDLDIVKQVMIKDFDNFPERGVEFDKDGLGANLFHADEALWRVLRNKFTPLFTTGKLKNMLHLMIDRSDDFIKYVENITRAQPEQEVFQLVQKFTIENISACAFGLDLDMTKEGDVQRKMRKIDKQIFTLNYAFELDMMYPGIISKIGTSLFPANIKRFFHDLVKQVVNVRKGEPTDRKDFMDLILELKREKQVHGAQRTKDEEKKSLELTEGIIAAQAFVFYAAGYESSATTMGFMLMQLAQNPEIQNKLAAEIKEVLRRHDDKVTYEALQDMTYLDRVFDETLRMYPVVDLILRKVVTDYKIPGSNAMLKKGQTVLISISGIHYDEEHWPNPLRFDPDRFSPENTANRHPAAYIPFGIGPRNCIGLRFAKVQSRVCMVQLLRRFRLLSTDHTRRDFHYDPRRIVLTPAGGFKIKLLPRE